MTDISNHERHRLEVCISLVTNSSVAVSDSSWYCSAALYRGGAGRKTM